MILQCFRGYEEAFKEPRRDRAAVAKPCVLLSQTKLLQTDKRWEQGEKEPENKTNDFEVGLESVLTGYEKKKRYGIAVCERRLSV
ncbi:unnamed protein product [Cyprideis torosa]|uniref:Uncharacterized protein n=1 Tax=Cyprideis torosa TaxID=163714 RepID=A0A7R8WLX2_9CRUS|nr:unnamed protein product [Cyprideis torosa]CAG0898730.1 unnamed protein product [Cyprideis torosa]